MATGQTVCRVYRGASVLGEVQARVQRERFPMYLGLLDVSTVHPTPTQQQGPSAVQRVCLTLSVLLDLTSASAFPDTILMPVPFKEIVLFANVAQQAINFVHGQFCKELGI